jgi:hypothetical protein
MPEVVSSKSKRQPNEIVDVNELHQPGKGTRAEVLPLVPERSDGGIGPMIRKLQSGEYRLYSRKLNPKTGKRRNLGTFKSRAAAEKHERAVQYFKRQ